jgi:hypothetical protein
MEAQVMAYVNVTRNPNWPRFLQQTYVANISENTEVGVSILRVTAVDDDGVSIMVSNFVWVGQEVYVVGTLEWAPFGKLLQCPDSCFHERICIYS